MSDRESKKHPLPWWIKAWVITLGATLLFLIGIIVMAWKLFFSF
jgi:hypothetical protein